MGALDSLRSHALALPLLAKFAIVMAIIVGVPRLCKRAGIPVVVGMLLLGVAVGPYGLDVFAQRAPVVDFLADLGKLLLMFFSGLEIDLATFRKARNRTIAFGLLTTFIPLALGTTVALAFGYPAVPAVVVGSLLASHTLIAMPAITRLGVNRAEPIIVTVGATVLSDTLSLIVFAVCVSTFERGFSLTGLAVQLAEIAVFIPVLFLVVGRIGCKLLRKVEHDEDAYFILMLGVVAVAGLLADVVDLPGIVGAFLAGLAVNTAVRQHPAKEKLEFLGNVLFIPIFFLVTGFLINPAAFARTLVDHSALSISIVGALLAGKWIAAQIAAHLFGYSRAARRTVWALTLPQVAATLAATLVAYKTFNPAHDRLLDDQMLNVVLVLVLVTSILGPVLVDRFAPRLAAESRP